MNDKELAQLLSSIKDAPELGGDFHLSEQEVAWEQISDSLGFSDAEYKKYGLQDYVQYFFWFTTHMLVRPLAVTISSFALVFGGWVFTVNASYDTVPGDVFYPVKIATERIQLSFAGSSEKKVKLHVEFAGRRIDELSEINRVPRAGNAVRLKAAIESFKNEMAQVNEELASINDQGSKVELASIVEQKTEDYQDAIDTVSETDQEGVGEELEGAITAAEDTNAQATDALVDAHEANQEVYSERALQKKFKNVYSRVASRISLNSSRITTIENVLNVYGNVEMQNTLNEAKQLITTHEENIHLAMGSFAAGGYRTAFDIFEEISTSLDQGEELIVDLEINLTSSFEQVLEEAIEEAEGVAQEAKAAAVQDQEELTQTE